jgi:hypothetical protein
MLGQTVEEDTLGKNHDRHIPGRLGYRWHRGAVRRGEHVQKIRQEIMLHLWIQIPALRHFWLSAIATRVDSSASPLTWHDATRFEMDT